MADRLKYIKKLNRDNYGIWKIRMRALLLQKDLWSVIENETGSDSTGDGRGNADQDVTGEASVLPTDTPNLDKSKKALSLITLALGNSQIVHVDECV